MPVRTKYIRAIRVFVVECPKKDSKSLTGGLVRVRACRECKYYCGAHGGDYVECNYEG